MNEIQTQTIDPKKPSSIDWEQLLFSFEGRVGRKQYWYYTLGVLIVFILIGVLAAVLPGQILSSVVKAVITLGIIVFGIALWIALLWSNLAIQVKRLHDLNKSGWFLLLILIPYIGPLIMMIWLGFFKGTDGDNRFGRPFTT
jgi:uncharacterized membrane protein YhaH (DUF805 family)